VDAIDKSSGQGSAIIDNQYDN